MVKMIFSRSPPMIEPAERCPAATRGCPFPIATRCSARRSSRRSPRASSRPSSAWAASGAPSACSGRRRASTRRRSATPAATRPNPTYEEVCSGAHRPHRGRARRLRPAADSATTRCCKLFWEDHDPTQGMRQGNDVGTQYRSAIYTHGDAQARRGRGLARGLSRSAERSRATARSRPRSPPAGPFYYAEDYHQQYLAKNPDGYCGSAAPACPARSASRASAPSYRRPPVATCLGRAAPRPSSPVPGPGPRIWLGGTSKHRLSRGMTFPTRRGRPCLRDVVRTRSLGHVASRRGAGLAGSGSRRRRSRRARNP